MNNTTPKDQADSDELRDAVIELFNDAYEAGADEVLERQFENTEGAFERYRDRSIKPVTQLFADQQAADRKALLDKLPEYFPDCEVYGASSSWCNNCWACKRRHDDEYVTGYEAAIDQVRNLINGKETK